MKITSNYLIDFMIKTYRYRHAHEDYQTLHQKQLEILLKYLKIPGKISFQDKKFSFEMLNDNCLNNFQLDDLLVHDRKQLIPYISAHINDMLDKITKETSIRSSGQMTTFEAYEVFHKAIHSHRNDYALRQLTDSMHKVYRDSIKDSLDLLFGFHMEDMVGWYINTSVTDESDVSILNDSICDYDYF